MKKARKLITFILVTVMVLSMSMTAWATDTADLTINGTVSGKSYDLYKVFDLSQSGDAYSYTVNSNFTPFFAGKGNEWSNPVEKVGSLTPEELAALAEEIVVWAIANDITVQTIEGTADSTVVENLPYGYYLLNPLGAQGASNGNATMFSLDTLSGANGVKEITVKAEYPTLTKEANTEEASIGEEITFTLSSKVPDMTGYTSYNYVVYDTLSSGLTFNSITSIKVGEDTLSEGTHYTLVQNGNEIKIVFKDFCSNYKDDAGDEVVIVYTAELNENAVVNGAGNDNTAYLKYSNDPKYDYQGDDPDDGDDDPNNDPPTGKTTEVETTTYTTELTINKTDSTNPLAGAAFRISGTSNNTVVTTGFIFVENNGGTYYKLNDNTYTETAPTAETETEYASTTTKYSKETVRNIETDNTNDVYAEAFVDDLGVLKFTGLGAGEYIITETVTPKGYNSINPITIVVTYDEEHNTFSYTKDGVDAGSTTTPITVVNNTGSELPSTGGIGTTIFYIAGGVLVLIAVVMLVTKKRMKED